ncbi:lipoprotein [Klebsiella pneumoniae]|uniref:Lipoprotein n=1 Tax=Klebsiella pneumoniae TaxID=573 RepID=A0A4P0XTC9_KLEPN|nr:lipoprotein [Klebsiella pneumoniae]
MTTARSSSGYGAFAAPAITVIRATAGDIEGVASGQAAGNAFHWRYSMNVEASGSRWLLHFDDWMFLQDGSHLFNKTEMKKFGITVATVTLFFTRTTAEERTAP